MLFPASREGGGEVAVPGPVGVLARVLALVE